MLEPDVTEADVTNAIYLALVHGETRNAGEWIKIGHEKFPDSENITGLEIWYLRTIGKTTEAQALADTLLSKNETHLIGLVQ